MDQVKSQLALNTKRMDTMEAEQKVSSNLLTKLDTKFDFMAEDIRKLTTSITEQFSKFDARLLVLEKMTDQVQPLEQVTKINQHEEFINQYKSANREQKAIRGYWFAIISIIVSLITAAAAMIGAVTNCIHICAR